MPALVAGIHVLKICMKKGVDSRDKPGHDGKLARIRMAGQSPAIAVA
jgi:hypothetical protein